MRNFKFIIQIIGLTAVPSTISQMGFMTCDGLGIQNELISYREGGDNTALPLDAPILTISGWKKMRDLQIGDRVIDPQGEDSKVVDLLPVVTKDTYELTLGDGSRATACWGHRWRVSVTTRSNGRSTERVVNTLEMKNLVDSKFPNGSERYHVRVPVMQPMQFALAPEPVLDPWLLGILLAEGDLAGDSIGVANIDAEILTRIEGLLPEGHFLWQDAQNPAKHRITVDNSVPGARNRFGRNKIREACREVGILGSHAWDKEIPEAYFWASIEDRLALLQGIMDGDGWVSQGGANFSSSSEQLTKDVRRLVATLGGRCGATTHTRDRSYVNKRGERCPARDSYSFSGISDITFVPFTLERKASGFRSSPKTSSQYRRVRSVEFVAEQPVRCVTVSAQSEAFVCYDYLPTLNTSRKMPGQSDFGALTFGRGMLSSTVGAYGQSTQAQGTETYAWLQQIFSVIEGAGTGGPGVDFRADLTIDVLDHPVTKGASAAGLNNPPPIRARFTVYNAWPLAMNWSGLDAGGNAIMIESLQIAHEGFIVTYGGISLGGAYVNPSTTAVSVAGVTP